MEISRFKLVCSPHNHYKAMQVHDEIFLCDDTEGLFWDGPCIFNDSWMPRYDPFEFEPAIDSFFGQPTTKDENIVDSSSPEPEFDFISNESIQPVIVVESPTISARHKTFGLEPSKPECSRLKCQPPVVNHKAKKRKVRQGRIMLEPNSRYVLQCKAVTTQGRRCRNAALLEYVGPQPQHCAQHIHRHSETQCSPLG
jgi:hypothetical protein